MIALYISHDVLHCIIKCVNISSCIVVMICIVRVVHFKDILVPRYWLTNA